MGDSVRNEISELLPFYVNETLDQGERQLVERALASDPRLRAELAVLEHVRTAIKSDDLGAGPGELGLARLKRDLSRPTPTWWLRAAAIAAAFGLGAVLSAVTTSRLSRGSDVYSQAGVPVVGDQLVVAFRPTATADQIAGLLLSQDLTIADGPSAIGLYRLSIPEGADAAAVATALAAANAIIESAEPTR